jgi:CDP-glycerol glycerophosphotransferase (TagB/SpsB family)
MFFHKITLVINAILVQSKFLFFATLLYPYSLFYKHLRAKEPLWIIGENEGRCLHDNGYVFYKFCRNNYPQRSIYFVTRKESISVDPFLKTDPNIIIFGSLKHVFFFLLSDTLIYSHAQSDVGYIQLIKLFKKNCMRVFLQHGIIGFKKIHSTYRKNHNEMDIFIVSSDFEKKIVIDNFDFDKDTIKVTGLARYDTLSNRSISHQKSILYMPTWRNWAFPKKNAVQHILRIEKLLNNKRLNSLLKKHSIQFNFCLHNDMRCYLNKIKTNENINIISTADTTIQTAIKENSLLITDYSSVAWDFFYLGKPVLFYQFDQEEYLSRKGSYIDFNTELFGDVFKECVPLVSAIEKYILNSFAELPEYTKKRDLYFNFRDTHNCKRIFDTISSHNDTKRG